MKKVNMNEISNYKKLDKNRQNYLLNHIHDIQAMITCTGLDEFVNCRFSIDKIFRVTDGTVVNEN